MSRTSRLIVVALATVGALSCTNGMSAGNRLDPIVLAGGAQLLVGAGVDCTLTAVGRDRAGRMLGLLAGHCGELGDPVSLSSTARPRPAIGQVVRKVPGVDIAIVEFDHTKTESGGPTVMVGDVPTPGSIVCLRTVTSGDCGPVTGNYRATSMVLAQVCSLPGDSGAPVFSGRQLVAMSAGNIGLNGSDRPCRHRDDPEPHNPAYMFPMREILEAVQTGGHIGTGLTLIS